MKPYQYILFVPVIAFAAVSLFFALAVQALMPSLDGSVAIWFALPPFVLFTGLYGWLLAKLTAHIRKGASEIVAMHAELDAGKRRYNLLRRSKADPEYLDEQPKSRANVVEVSKPDRAGR